MATFFLHRWPHRRASRTAVPASLRYGRCMVVRHSASEDTREQSPTGFAESTGHKSLHRQHASTRSEG